MHEQLRRIAIIGAILAFLTAMPGLARAVGLGQIKSDTHIGQPLKARIPIVTDNAQDLQGLKVGLANLDAYKQAGLQLSDYLFTLEFKVKQGAHGPYVLVTSTKPVKLPFLNLLVRARWTSGQVTRQYTLLLNPPVFANNKKKAGQRASTPAAVSEPTSSRTPPRSEQVKTTRTGTSTATRATGGAGAVRAHRYGPVEHGDTLWGIANHLRGNSALSVNQMMIAIYRANPQAFSGNINRLKTGTVLNVPAKADIARISRHSATSEVEDQHQSWQAAKASSGKTTRVAEENATGSISGQIQSTRQGGESVSGRQQTVENTASRESNEKGAQASSGTGEVVLTAPKVAESPAAGAGGERTANKTPEAPGTVAAGAGAAVAGHQSENAGEIGETGSNGSVAASSSGGPLKVQGSELAALASNSASGGAAASPPSGKEQNQASSNAQPPSNGTPAVNTGGASNTPETANTGNATSGSALGGTVWGWLTSVKGWIVIALIVLLIVLIVFLVLRRRREHEHLSAADRVHDEPLVTAAALLQPGEDEHAATADAVAGEETAMDASEEGAEASQTVASELQVREETPESEQGESDEATRRPAEPAAEEAGEDETALADALVEADFYAGSGDHGGAAGSLATALEHAPERNDLRLRRMEELFAAGEREAFRSEASALHARVSENSDDWQTVAVMGRQLLPDETLFHEGGSQGAGADATEDAADNDITLDVDHELDRLTRTEEDSHGLQDDFEQTLGELSTMIETYMPEDGKIPDELQKPSDEKTPEAPPTALQEEVKPRPEEDDDVLEFEPQTLPGEQADDPARESDSEPAGGDETLEAPAGKSSMNLELARSYVDMGERESAREVLEEVLTSADSDASLRDQARQLLEGLNPEREAPLYLSDDDTADEHAAPPASEPRAPDTGSDEDGQAGEQSGTMLDLARAYIEMGDRESARDVLEEVLDGQDEAQIKAARELLETVET